MLFSNYNFFLLLTILHSCGYADLLIRAILYCLIRNLQAYFGVYSLHSCATLRAFSHNLSPLAANFRVGSMRTKNRMLYRT